MRTLSLALCAIPLLLAACSSETAESDPDGNNSSSGTESNNSGSETDGEGDGSKANDEAENEEEASGGGPASGGSASGSSTGGGETGTGGFDGGTGGNETMGSPLGATCAEDSECESEQCDEVCLTQAGGCTEAGVEKTPGNNWSDSYSVDGKCYCATTFDHAIGTYEVDTPVGKRTVQQVCDALGPGPGIEGNPVYNDIQCGNGPANDAGDEGYCPGRVDQGRSGCCTIGPKWDLSEVE